MNSSVAESLFKLKQFIEAENYAGYDPYDALKSPLFRLPFFRNNYYIRFLAQQLVKRSPVNLRPLLQIQKGVNPVTLGLCLQGNIALAESGLIPEKDATDTCNELLHHLRGYISKGYSGTCWGYDFPWQSRHFNLAAYQPSIVSTGIITNALFKWYTFNKNAEALELCKSATDFILNDLYQYKSDAGICFSYTPFDQYRVFNASMKAARALAQVYSVTRNEQLLQFASEAVRFVIHHQNKNGSWYYADGSKGKWIDNYHTGYILDCLNDYATLTGDTTFNRAIQLGFEYYYSNFIENGNTPKFYSDARHPLDCTAAAQTILTLCRFGKKETAEKVAQHLVQTMQNSNGSFQFRAFKNYTIKTSFMRWSNAWMFASLSTLLANTKDHPEKGLY